MKKILSLICAFIFCLIMCITFKAEAVTLPEYNPTFNGNKGIFYANGTPVTIRKNDNNETVIVWDEGSQVVGEDVFVVGGGKEGTSFEQSNIVMKDGTVGKIYAGGASLVENSIATVTEGNVTIEGGIVKETVAGGGLIYAQVNNTKVIINGGTVKGICGGGAGYAVINGVTYNAGTEENPIESKNRVINSEVIINDGIIDSTPTNFGLVYGGPQGYSFVENSKVTINGGDLSKAYVTVGGANGYTKNVELVVNDGNISFLQTVNRGEIENAKVTVNGGSIENAYVGGETEASDVTGKVNNIDFRVLDGRVGKLQAGKNNSQALVIDQDNYKVVEVKGKVEQSLLDKKEIVIEPRIQFEDKQERILVNSEKQLVPQITTIPEGYENLFTNENVKWTSDNEEIAKVDQNGVVTGLKDGIANITANLVGNTDEVEVTVVTENLNLIILLLVVLFIIILIIIILGLTA